MILLVIKEVGHLENPRLLYGRARRPRGRQPVKAPDWGAGYRCKTSRGFLCIFSILAIR